MELYISELGTTLAVGAYCVITLDLMFLLIFKYDPMTRIAFGKKYNQFIVTVLFFVINFAVGMLVEDLSNKFADEDSYLGLNLLQSEKELRTSVFLSAQGQLTPIAREFLDADIVQNFNWNTAKIMKLAVEHNNGYVNTWVSEKDMSRIANRIYYQANNQDFVNDNYFDVLRAIQVRIDFARSMAILSVFLLIAWILALLGVFLLKKVDSEMTADSRLFERVGQYIKTRSARTFTWMNASMMGLFILLYWAGHYAYAAEEGEYNKRVFGYYVTLKQKKSETDTDTKPSTPSAASQTTQQVPGISGMVHFPVGNEDWYVAVHDHKFESSLPRVSMLRQAGDSMQVTPVIIRPLSHQWPSSDIEAICKIGNRSNEFLLAESGYHKGQYGRLFYVTLDYNSGLWVMTIQSVIKHMDNVDNIEGMICPLSTRTDDVLVIFGERGATHQGIAGELKINIINLNSHTQSNLAHYPVSTQSLSNKHQRMLEEFDQADKLGRLDRRDIADLYLDESNTLWSSLTRDGGNNGPFLSILRPIAQLHWMPIDVKSPLKGLSLDKLLKIVIPRTSQSLLIQHTKIEAIAKAHGSATWQLASDDENFGGFYYRCEHTKAIKNTTEPPCTKLPLEPFMPK